MVVPAFWKLKLNRRSSLSILTYKSRILFTTVSASMGDIWPTCICELCTLQLHRIDLDIWWHDKKAHIAQLI